MTGLHTRGLVLLELGRFGSAEQRLRKAIRWPTSRLQRSYQMAYLTAALLRQGKKRQASRYWSKALHLAPTSPAVRHFRSEVEATLNPRRTKTLA